MDKGSLPNCFLEQLFAKKLEHIRCSFWKYTYQTTAPLTLMWLWFISNWQNLKMCPVGNDRSKPTRADVWCLFVSSNNLTSLWAEANKVQEGHVTGQRQIYSSLVHLTMARVCGLTQPSVQTFDNPAGRTSFITVLILIKAMFSWKEMAALKCPCISKCV